MAVKDWSTTPGNNTSPGDVNFAEAQLPSTVNNSMRQVLADLRTHLEDGGWFNFGHTTVYASSTTFTVASTDVRTIYTVGRRVRAVGSSTGTIYGVVTGSAFSSNSTVTIVWDSGSLSSESLAISVSVLDINGHLDAAKILSGTLPNARLDQQLQDVAGLAVTDGNFIVGDGSNFVAESGATARASIGLPLSGWTMSGALTLSGDPSSANHAANKNYIDNLLLGMGKRGTVRAATTANITIATALNNGDTLDGVTLATNDLVLVKNQTDAEDNGVYVVQASPARDDLYDTFVEHVGALIVIQEGTTNADHVYICTSNAGGTLNTDALDWSKVQPSNSGTVTSIVAGTGLSGGTITGSGTIGFAANALTTIGGTSEADVVALSIALG